MYHVLPEYAGRLWRLLRLPTHLPRSAVAFRRALQLLLGTALVCFSTAFAANSEPGPPVTVTGKLEVLYADDFANQRAELMHFIEDKQNNRRFRLRLPGKAPAHWRTGTTVTVRGQAKGRELILAADGTESSSSEPPVAPAVTAVTGEQSTLVMVANFSDKSVSCSVDAIRDLMFTDAADQSIDDLYQETSHGGVWLNGQVVGPYNINYSSNTCDYGAWGQAADADARASGVEPDAYDRKVYVMPPSGCPAAGIGTIGGSPSRAWVFTCNIVDVYAHELGHNLGMHHAATPSAEYGDNTDVMGLGQNRLRQVNAPHKEQMGWLIDVPAQLVSQGGTYDIAPLELSATQALAPRAIKIAKADTNEYYYLSYRRAIGFDANLISSLYLDQLSVHRYSGDGNADKTYLLSIIADGESFVDPVNGITVTQVSHNTDYVTVQLQFDGTCSVNAPTVTMTPASQSAAAGSTLSYNVSVVNQDSPACGASTFDLVSSVPFGWSDTVTPAVLSLAPGATGQATLWVTSASGAVTGSFTVGVNAADTSEPSHAASGSASYIVEAPCTGSAPIVSLAPGSQGATPGATLAYTVSVTNADGAACTQSTFALSEAVPTGWLGTVLPASLTLSPGASGQATLSVTSSGAAAQRVYTVEINVDDTAEPAHTASDNAAYEVLAVEDTQPPSAPSDLSASVKRKQINLAWDPATDNVGVTGYQVWRDGALLAATSDTSYADRSAPAGVTCTYFVVAGDAAGNVSAQSNSATAAMNGGGGNGGGKGKKP